MQVNRTGARSIALGTGRSGLLSLPYLPQNTDVIVGDLLVSSGLGGVYPPGYPVGKVTAVVRDPGQPLLAVEAEPLAGLDRDPEILLVWFDNEVVEPEPAGSRSADATATPAGAAGAARRLPRRTRRQRPPAAGPDRDAAPRRRRKRRRERRHRGEHAMMRGTRINFGWGRVIGLTVLALAATVAPLPEWLEPYRPDFVALTVLWFCLLSPRLLGLTYGWCAGLALDGFSGVLLGQHALTLTVIAYVACEAPAPDPRLPAAAAVGGDPRAALAQRVPAVLDRRRRRPPGHRLAPLARRAGRAPPSGRCSTALYARYAARR